MHHEQRLFWLTLTAGIPGSALALLLLWLGDYSSEVCWTLTLALVVAWIAVAASIRRRVVFPLQTLWGLLTALREGDYSLRATMVRRDEELKGVTQEINALAETLQWHRMDAVEVTTLLQKVVHEIDMAIFSFDETGRLQLVNHAGEQLLGKPWRELLDSGAGELGLAECLEGPPRRVADMSFPGGAGRWDLRRTTFRRGGKRNQLVVLADLSRALREEERRAWLRIVRVLAHELNNSLVPISSISASLTTLVEREPRPPEWEEDVRHGLGIISSRSASLERFVESYASIARPPHPRFEDMDVGSLVRRVVGMEPRLRVECEPGPEVVLRADGGQIEQTLINMLRNAVEAALDTGGGVRVGWAQRETTVDIWVDDEGPGLINTSNIFVPFFTTKKDGLGIGLVLSRQIAEAHGGTLTLENREPGPGCRALIRLPGVRRE